MKYYILTGGILAFIVLLIVLGVLEEAKRKNKALSFFKNSFGKIIPRKLSENNLLSLGKFHESSVQKDDFCIDKITADDLHVVEIFEKMNSCITQAGEAVLFHRVHTYMKSEEEIPFENRQNVLASQEEFRLNLQMHLRTLYKKDEENGLGLLDEESMQFAYKPYQAVLLWLFYVATIFMLFVKTGVGIIMLVLIIAFSVLSYFVKKSGMLVYLESLHTILRTIKIAKRMKKDGVLNHAEFNDFDEKNNILLKKLEKIAGSASYIVAAESASGSISALARDYLNMLFHIDLFAFALIYRDLYKQKDTIMDLWGLLGTIDAEIAIASFRKAVPYYCIPVFWKEDKLQMEEGYHLLIKRPVPNSFCLAKPVILTGSNASGKSTFLRMVAQNVLLGQCIHTAFARNMSIYRCRIYSAMTVHDDIQGGDSYYMAEIKALHRIENAAKESIEMPVVCVVDEILRGTNTVERIAASTEILKNFQQKKVFCLGATHDIELTGLLSEFYENMHFEEEMEEGDIKFSYKLKPGPATTRNAIHLLELIGFDEAIVNGASKRAEAFAENGRWV